MNAYSGIRYLNPNQVAFDRNDEGGLKVVLSPTETYDFVRVYRVSPVSSPTKYISLRVGYTKSDQKEIGIITDIDELSEKDRELIYDELAKRYFAYTVTKITSIKQEFAFLYFEAETDRGPVDFALAEWMHGNIRDNGRGGRVIVDINGSRFVIPDLETMDDRSKTLWKRYIYW